MNHWELLATHKHIKSGGLYRVISDTALEVTQDEAQRVVVYENEAGQVYVQDYNRFNDGRFTTIQNGEDE